MEKALLSLALVVALNAPELREWFEKLMEWRPAVKSHKLD